MIIVSRDKKSIHNFDNILNIQIEKIDNTYKLIIYDEINDRSSLGEYRTEKRAKEVLQEIAKTYASYLKLEGGPALLQGQKYIQPNIFNIPKVYYMPEK